MISTLRSIDNLLHRFDELSQYHANFLSNFESNFSDVKNPLRNVARTEEEQRKTNANILLIVNENDDRLESFKTLEDFHRRIIKSRYLHRPPSYSSNDSSLIHRVPSRSTSITTESTSLPRISQVTTKVPEVNLTTKIKPNVVRENPPAPRRYARDPVKAFTMETVNRLSTPKIYNQLPDEKPSIKRVQQRPKHDENIKNEVSKCCTLPPIKRTKATTIEPSLKKLKPENKIPIPTRKRNSIPNFSRPLIFLAPAPIIRLSFPLK